MPLFSTLQEMQAYRQRHGGGMRMEEPPVRPEEVAAYAAGYAAALTTPHPSMHPSMHPSTHPSMHSTHPSMHPHGIPACAGMGAGMGVAPCAVMGLVPCAGPPCSWHPYVCSTVGRPLAHWCVPCRVRRLHPDSQTVCYGQDPLRMRMLELDWERYSAQHCPLYHGGAERP